MLEEIKKLKELAVNIDKNTALVEDRKKQLTDKLNAIQSTLDSLEVSSDISKEDLDELKSKLTESLQKVSRAAQVIDECFNKVISGEKLTKEEQQNMKESVKVWGEILSTYKKKQEGKDKNEDLAQMDLI